MSKYDVVLEANPIYNQMISRYRYLYNSYIGGHTYAEKGYLTRYSTESDVEYEERLRATPLDNHCKGTINIYNAFLFRAPIARDFGNLVLDPALEPFLGDADLEGRSLDAVMKDISTYASIFGSCWAMLAKPQTNARTRADELNQEIRPYITLITPMSVLDWRFTRAPNGVYFLTYLKVMEDCDQQGITIIKEWTEESITTYTLNDELQTMVSQEVEINGLGRIPAVCVYNQRTPQRGIGISDIEDIARQQQAIYNEYSEIESSIRLNGHPSLVKSAGTEASAGAGSIIQMEDNLDPGLKPYMLTVSNNTDAIYNSIDKKIESIDRMANTASVRARSTRVLSGVAMQVEFSMLNARLSEKADNLELAEEQIWRLFALYQAQVWTGKIEYPDSFNIQDKDNDYNNLLKAKQAATDPRVLNVIDHEIIEMLGEDADLIMPEMVALQDGTNVPADSAEPFEEPEELYNPATGESGWVIDFQAKREAMLAGWIEVE